MAYSIENKAKRLLADPAGLFNSGNIGASLDRGARDLGRRGFAIQKREIINLESGTRTYTLSNDHVQTFVIFREKYSASIRMKSQDGTVWYITVSTTGVPTASDTVPAGNILLTASDVYWMEIPSPDLTTWYVYVTNLGLIKSSDTQPVVGTGTAQIVQMRDEWGTPWYFSVDNVGLWSTGLAGTASVAATALDDKALVRVEPEAITRVDPRATSGPPIEFAITGKILHVHPTPDDTYQLDHKYFSSDPDALPQAWQHQPIMYAVAQEIQRLGRLTATQQLLAMNRAELGMLAENLMPGGRDGLEFYKLSVG